MNPERKPSLSKWDLEVLTISISTLIGSPKQIRKKHVSHEQRCSKFACKRGYAHTSTCFYTFPKGLWGPKGNFEKIWWIPDTRKTDLRTPMHESTDHHNCAELTKLVKWLSMFLVLSYNQQCECNQQYWDSFLYCENFVYFLYREKQKYFEDALPSE